MALKTEHLFINISLDDFHVDHARDLCKLLNDGYEIVNSTGTKYGIVYILKRVKVIDDVKKRK